jgi:hypothetical protein
MRITGGLVGMEVRSGAHLVTGSIGDHDGATTRTFGPARGGA